MRLRLNSVVFAAITSGLVALHQETIKRSIMQLGLCMGDQ
jgi:hypothetical protein